MRDSLVAEARRAFETDHSVLDVLGYIHNHGTGTSTSRQGKGRRMVASSCVASVTRNTCLAHAPMMLLIGASWNASLPIACVADLPADDDQRN